MRINLNISKEWQPVATIPLGRKVVELQTATGIICKGYYRQYNAEQVHIKPAYGKLPPRVACCRVDLPGGYGDVIAFAWRPLP